MYRGVAIALGALVLLAPLASTAGEAPELATQLRLAKLRKALELHRSATGALPRDAKQLAVVVQLYSAKVPLENGLAVDGWGRAFLYATAQTPAGYRLYSAGANGRDESGAGDDVGAAAAEEAETSGPGHGVERALQLLPILSLVVVGPIAWAFIRAARRGLG